MRRSSRRQVLLVSILAIVGLVAAGCGGDGDGDGGQAAGGSVKLGFFGALTGPNAQLGINIKNGAKLAVDQYNQGSPSTKVELVDYDSQGDPAQAPQLAQKAATDKVVGIIGPAFSGESRVANPVFEEAKIPNVTPSATGVDLAANGWKYWYRLLANDDAQAPADADYIAKKLGAKKAAVIDDASEYGKGLADGVREALKSNGVDVAVSGSINPKEQNYSSTVNAIQAGNVEAIFYGGYYAEAGRLLKQIRDAGLNTPFVSDDGSLDQKLVDTAGKQAAEGAVATCACLIASTAKTPESDKFVQDYKAAFGVDPATYSAEGFDAANVLLEAVKAGKTSGEDINNHLKTLTYKGITKEIKFGSNGEVEAGEMYIYDFKAGAISLIGPASEVAA
jgi:branched-chain amino acid transport system substrate-binding protein